MRSYFIVNVAFKWNIVPTTFEIYAQKIYPQKRIDNHDKYKV